VARHPPLLDEVSGRLIWPTAPTALGAIWARAVATAAPRASRCRVQVQRLAWCQLLPAVHSTVKYGMGTEQLR